MKEPAITYCKGIGIILMVLGHSACSIPYIIQILYMFHMPLFFFFSGYCFKDGYIHNPKQFLLKRVKGIYWPYVKWSLLFLLFHNVFFALHVYNHEYGTIMGSSKEYTLNNFFLNAYIIVTHMNGHDQLLGGYWFLRALFFGSIIAFSLILFANFIKERYSISEKRLDVVKIMLPLAFTIVINHTQAIIPFFHFGSQPTLVAVFFMIGYYFRKYKVAKWTHHRILIGSLIVVVGSFYWRSDTNYLYYDNMKMIPFIVTGVIGTWGLYSINWYSFNNHILRFLSYVGSNSLVILTWHFLCFKLVTFVIILSYGLSIYRLAEFPVVAEYSSVWWFAYFVVGVVVPILFKHLMSLLNNISLH